MESIYFEKQEGLLCAQHCLNALLQGQYFTPVGLAELAKDLDEEEKQKMGESGVDTEEYRKFMQQPSQNMDDSGYFSVQVISRCLSIWGLELVRYGSTNELAVEAQTSPEKMCAYICNYKDHWFTVRKIGGKWFDLNSVNKGPTIISNTFLSLYLAQLQQEGYSIFLINGELPFCEADEIIRKKYSQLGTSAPPSSPNHSHQLMQEDEVAMEAAEESEFQRALQLSLTARRDLDKSMEQDEDDDDDDFKRAIQLSLNSAFPIASGSGIISSGPSNCQKMEKCTSVESIDMDAELEAAVRLSLECTGSPHS